MSHHLLTLKLPAWPLVWSPFLRQKIEILEVALFFNFYVFVKVQLGILSHITEGRHFQQMIQTMMIIRITVLLCIKVHGGIKPVVIPISMADIIMALIVMELTEASRGITGKQLIIPLKTVQ